MEEGEDGIRITSEKNRRISKSTECNVRRMPNTKLGKMEIDAKPDGRSPEGTRLLHITVSKMQLNTDSIHLAFDESDLLMFKSVVCE